MSDDHPDQYTVKRERWGTLKARSREMRHQPTSAEEHLWKYLRGRRLNGAKFRRQHAIDQFIVDFVCIEQLLIVEVDGLVHEVPDQRDRDVNRQAHLEGMGYRILRFTNAEVLQSVRAVLEVIGAALQE
ncbi:MAG: endonuclease domain-containing protein [Anaerolineae bacterium]|nr:endonuclease domain-containing protein [Anaerolineae bacterium]